MIKIFHTADIHLDTPFSLSDPIESEKRRQEFRDTFCNVISKAKEYGAEIFLISGDFFEDIFITKNTADLVVREISNFPSCRFFICAGNHDPYSETSPYALLNWPENAYIFKSPSLSYVDIPEKNLRIYGYSYTDKNHPENIFENFTLEDISKINILMAHGFINMPSDTCNIMMEKDAEKFGFDYIALGHVHSHTGFMKYGNTIAAYPGCMLGRDFNEDGFKGVICGCIEKGRANLEFCRVSDKHFEKVSVDISGTKTVKDAISKITNSVSHLDGNTYLKITAEGITSPDVLLSDEIVLENLKRFPKAEFIDNTLPLFEFEKLKQDKTIVGSFFRKIEPMLYDEDTNKRKTAMLALRYGLAALLGKEVNL